jgi:FAD:protein FMN transferase
MVKFAKVMVFLLLAMALVRPADAASPWVRYEDSHNSMGTVYTVVAYGEDSAFLAEAVREVFDEIDRLDAQMSNYKPQSELSGINREAAQRGVMVEPRLFKLIQDSMSYSDESDGAFDITVGPLLKAWGFFRGQGRVPSNQELASVMKRIGYRHILLDPARREIRFDTEGIELDLGAIAKGYALDRTAEILRARGIQSALVSSGTSSIYGLGTPPDEAGWKVSIRDPLDEKKVADTVRIKNYSLSVSGDYEKFFTLHGRIYSHIFNPKTGRPVENMLSTAVLAPLGETSDALSTSFYVMGPERSRVYLKQHPDLRVIFYLPGNTQGKFKRLEMRSNSFRIPPDSLAEIKVQREQN